MSVAYEKRAIQNEEKNHNNGRQNESQKTELPNVQESVERERERERKRPKERERER